MAYTSGKYEVAAAAAQEILRAFEPKMYVDGKFGTYTMGVYTRAPASLKVRVDAAVRAIAGGSVENLLATRSLQKSGNMPAPTQKAMRELVASIAQREGVPVDTALRICWLESKFNPNAKSPTGAKGLFQFTSIATRDVAQRASFNLAGKEFDPESNSIAAMRYIKLVGRDLGVPLSDVVSIYMGFNIGPEGAKAVKRGSITPQIAKAIGQQAYGAPDKYASNLANAVKSAVV